MRRPLTDAETPVIVRHYAPRGAADVPEDDIFDVTGYCPAPVNAGWLPHIIGALNVLDQPDAWSGSPSEIAAARNAIRRWIATFVVCDDE